MSKRITGRMDPSGSQTSYPLRGDRGVARRLQVLAAARAIMISDGSAGLTVRNVASRVGIKLASVQYYFRTKAELVDAMMEETTRFYEAQITSILERPSADPRDRFLSVVAFLVSDLRTGETARFFFELWALASRESRHRELVDRLYVHYRNAIKGLVRDLNPELGTAELERRAALVVSLIEGSTLFLGRDRPVRARVPGLEESIVETALELATASAF